MEHSGSKMKSELDAGLYKGEDADSNQKARVPGTTVRTRASRRSFLALIQHISFPFRSSCAMFSTTAPMGGQESVYPLFPRKLVVKPGAIFTDDRENFNN